MENLPLHPFRIEPDFRQLLLLGTMVQMPILYPQIEDLHGPAMTGKTLIHSRSCTTHDDMFLNGHQQFMAVRHCKHTILIERFYKAHVHHRGIQGFANFEGWIYHGAEGQDRNPPGITFHITTNFRLSDGNCGHLLVLGDAGSTASRVSHGSRSLVLVSRVQHVAAFRLIGGRHDHHVGNAPQECVVIGASMGRTVSTNKSGPVDGKQNIQVLDRYVVDQLVIGPL